jgi:hypothetical protein
MHSSSSSDFLIGHFHWSSIWEVLLQMSYANNSCKSVRNKIYWMNECWEIDFWFKENASLNRNNQMNNWFLKEILRHQCHKFFRVRRKMSESAAAIIGSKFGMKKMGSFIKYCENIECVQKILRHRCRKFFVLQMKICDIAAANFLWKCVLGEKICDITAAKKYVENKK